MPETLTKPVYVCDCGRELDFSGRRIGDTIDCPGCSSLRVLIRSKIQGPLADADALARNLTAQERGEVEQAFANIKARRTHERQEHGELHRPRWIFALGLLGVYMAGLLAYQNLETLGKPVRGRRTLILAVGAYLLVLLGCIGGYVFKLPTGLLVSAFLGTNFFGSLLIYAKLQRDTKLGFETGGRDASLLVPTLFSVTVALGQGVLLRVLTGTSGF